MARPLKPRDGDRRSPPAPWARQLAELDAVYPSRSSLARDLGVCSQTVGHWLAGSHAPTTASVIRIGERYGQVVPLDVVRQSVVLAIQSLDAVLEMTTVEGCHMQAERCRARLAALALGGL